MCKRVSYVFINNIRLLRQLCQQHRWQEFSDSLKRRKKNAKQVLFYSKELAEFPSFLSKARLGKNNSNEFRG